VPEGDTIFRAARTLNLALAGRVVTRFESVLPALSRIDTDTPLAGRTVDRVWAQGKHLLIGFSGGLTLRTHMRMSGSWHVYRPGEKWQRPRGDMRITIETDAFVAVAFQVPVAEFLTEPQTLRARPLRTLGPDLLSETFDESAALARLRERNAMALGEALLDQRAVSGIGNVYKSETCFVARANPFAPVSALDDAQVVHVLQVARQLMKMNVRPGAEGGIVTYRGLSATDRSDRGGRHWVYGRRGRPCRRCGSPIRAEKQGADARTTYWCGRCQGPTEQQ
jgi:endonuclease-8